MATSHLLRRGATVALSATLVAAGLVATAPAASALPQALDGQELVIPMVDPQTLARCDARLTLSARPWPVTGGLDELGFLRVSTPRSCGTVTWTARFTIIDESPGHATRAVSDEGTGNPAYADARQFVAYGLGIREVGLITFQWEATSRFGTICAQEWWTMDAVTMQPTWVSLSPGCS